MKRTLLCVVAIACVIGCKPKAGTSGQDTNAAGPGTDPTAATTKPVDVIVEATTPIDTEMAKETNPGFMHGAWNIEKDGKVVARLKLLHTKTNDNFAGEFELLDPKASGPVSPASRLKDGKLVASFDAYVEGTRYRFGIADAILAKDDDLPFRFSNQYTGEIATAKLVRQ